MAEKSIGRYEYQSIGVECAQSIVDAIASTLKPEEVFEMADLAESVKRFYEPEDVFPAAALAAWAEDNGYVKA